MPMPPVNSDGSIRGPIAPDVKSGDAVFWNEETGRFEKAQINPQGLYTGRGVSIVDQVEMRNVWITRPPVYLQDVEQGEE